ncbi:hypothetical protein GCM10023083_62690 [Streptomyces phyllanthi]
MNIHIPNRDRPFSEPMTRHFTEGEQGGDNVTEPVEPVIPPRPAPALIEW